MAPKLSKPAGATVKRPAAAGSDNEIEKKIRKDMLGWMKYVPAPSGNPDKAAEEAEEAQTRAQAAAVYQALDAAGKSSFIARWNSSSDKKKGQWLRDFTEGLEKTKVFLREKKTDMLTRQLQEANPPCIISFR